MTVSSPSSATTFKLPIPAKAMACTPVEESELPLTLIKSLPVLAVKLSVPMLVNEPPELLPSISRFANDKVGWPKATTPRSTPVSAANERCVVG